MIFFRRTVIQVAAAAAAASGAAAQSGDPATRIVTTPEFEGPVKALRVSWLHWDSPFRAAGLAIGDRIVAVNGTPIAPPAEGGRALQRYTQTAIGQYEELSGLAALKLKPGDPLALAVRRRAAPTGWQTLTITATLAAPVPAAGPTGRRLMGPNGPEEMASDGFGDSWSSWDEKLVRDYGLILDGGWQRKTFVSRVELRRHMERKPRVEALAARWPGPYARAMAADWETVRACLDGPAVTLPPGALDFRREAEEKIAKVSAAAKAAWDQVVAALAPTTIPAFPAQHPIRGDRRAVIGKHVVLPDLGNRNWISEAGHGWFLAGTPSDNFYAIDAEAPPAVAMLRARNRYQKLVSPRIDATFRFIGQVTEEPTMLVVGDRAQFCLQLRPVAALVGDAMFVDLSAAEPHFAGEELFAMPQGALPPDDAAPAAVMQALIAAGKAGDQALWGALFSPWIIDRLPDGRALLQTGARPPDSAWVQTRASLMGRVADARVPWADDPVLVADGKAYPGAPKIEQVTVEIDHIGQFPEGDRVFTDVTVNRVWTLQRIDLGQGFGPWRVHSMQPI